MMCRIAQEIQLIFSTFIPIFSVIMIHLPFDFSRFRFIRFRVAMFALPCHVVTLSRPGRELRAQGADHRDEFGSPGAAHSEPSTRQGAAPDHCRC